MSFSTPRRPCTAASPRAYSKLPSISIPCLSLNYPATVPHADITHKFDFATNASLISPRGSNALLSCHVPNHLKPSLHPKDYHENLAIASPGLEEEKKADAMNLNSLRSPGIRIRPVLRSQRFRAFHNDQSPSPSRSISTTPEPKTPSLELPAPTTPTRKRSVRWRNKLGTLFVTTRQRWHILSHPTSYIALYFMLNLSLTLYNKALLNNFPFPYTLSALHALCGSIGCTILVRNGSNPVPRLNAQEKLVLFAFSILYTINIIISNVSLGLVTVPFHQVVRASTPLFTILFSALILGTWSSRRKLVSLLPVVAGVAFATYGDYYFTPWGFFLTLFGTILASLKTIFTSVLQTSPTPAPSLKDENPFQKLSPAPSLPTFKLPPLSSLHLLYLLSPFAFIESILFAHFTGELDTVLELLGLGWATSLSRSTHAPTSPISILPRMSIIQIALVLINGIMAFALNVVSFSASRKVGALSMTVAANVKQVLTVLCAVMLFDLRITPMNGVGIGLTLIGGVVYAAVELEEKRQRR